MIERSFDADFFNEICNRPEVRDGLGGEGFLDTSSVVTDPKNYALRTEYGGFILIAHGAGFYSVHTQFAAEGRGAHAIAAMRAGLDFMFTRTDAMRLTSLCPDNNPAAMALATKGGARPWFRKEHDPQYGPGVFVQWDLLDWMTSTPELEEGGRAFHALSEGAIKAAGLDLPEHPDDPVHDRVVGAAMLMCKRGQPAKGVLTYNLWAMSAGYSPVSLVSADPPVVDCSEPGIVEMTLGLGTDGDLVVLSCR